MFATGHAASASAHGYWDNVGVRGSRRVRLWVVILVIIAFIAINAPGITALFYRFYFGHQVAALPEARGPEQGDRLLVMAPHPDDETLCCAGSIQKAIRAGASVYVVWFTSGDAFEWDAALLNRTPDPAPIELFKLGKSRIREAADAAKLLGVPGQNQFFLGYPDRGLSKLLKSFYSRPYRSPYTEVDAVPYMGTVSPGSAYTGKNMVADFETVLAKVKPTIILAPSPRDAHPDHRAVAELALRLLNKRGKHPVVRYWIVHGGLEWPLPKGLHRTLVLEPPPRGKGLPWERVSLDITEENRKLAAIRTYQTQTEVLGRFMLAFVRTNELYYPETR